MLIGAVVAVLALFLYYRHGRCSKPSTAQTQQQEIRVFVGILSRSINTSNRAAIRATWGGHPALYRVLFFLARTLDKDVFEKASGDNYDPFVSECNPITNATQLQSQAMFLFVFAGLP